MKHYLNVWERSTIVVRERNYIWMFQRGASDVFECKEVYTCVSEKRSESFRGLQVIYLSKGKSAYMWVRKDLNVSEGSKECFWVKGSLNLCEWKENWISLKQESPETHRWSDLWKSTVSQHLVRERTNRCLHFFGWAACVFCEGSRLWMLRRRQGLPLAYAAMKRTPLNHVCTRRTSCRQGAWGNQALHEFWGTFIILHLHSVWIVYRRVFWGMFVILFLLSVSVVCRRIFWGLLVIMHLYSVSAVVK